MNTERVFHVDQHDGNVVVSAFALPVTEVSRAEALTLAAELVRLAAQLVQVADEPIAFDQATFETQHGPAVLSIEFLELVAQATEGT